LHKYFSVTSPKKRKLSDALDCNGNIVKSDKYYSGTCAIRHLSFPTTWDIRQKFMVPKYFLLTKIKPEYSEILYNPTHIPGVSDYY